MGTGRRDKYKNVAGRVNHTADLVIFFSFTGHFCLAGCRGRDSINSTSVICILKRKEKTENLLLTVAIHQRGKVKCRDSCPCIVAPFHRSTFQVDK